MKILCFLTDIFFIPKIQELLKGDDIEFLDSYNDEGFDLLILDMDHKDSLSLCKRFPEKSFCFGSHMDREKIQEFKSTGCKNVFARSIFLNKLGEIT